MAGPLRWLFLDLNSFFASCEQQLQPALRLRPVGVLPTMAESTSIIAASHRAKLAGVGVGTRAADARQRCPDIALVPSRPAVYVEFHHKILKAIEPLLHVDHVLSIDEVACRLTGELQQPEAAQALARRIKQAILREAGECLTCSIGLAPNRYLGKVASNMQKPNGLVTLLPEDLPQALYPLALQDLPGIGPRMAKRLARHGIFTTQQLLALDSMRLRGLWGGITGVRFHADLHGEDIASRATETTSLGHQHVLEPALRTYDEGLRITRQLLVKATERMRRNGFYAQSLMLQVRLVPEHFGAPKLYVEGRMQFHETQDTGFLLHCLETLWREHMHHQRPWRTGVILGGLVPATAHQDDLFNAPKRARLMQTLDAINQRFGRYTVNIGQNTQQARRTGMDKIAFRRVPTQAETEVISTRKPPPSAASPTGEDEAM